MSESRTKLETILELLLAEDNDQAEAMLHEFVVDKARSEYEKLLDESTDEEIEESEEDDLEESFEEETIDQGDQVDDLEDDIASIEDEETFEADDEMDDMGDDEEMMMGDDEEGEDDLEDKVEDLEAELEDLRAEFEKLMADEEGEEGEEGEEDEMDMDMNMDMEEPEMESFEYDLDEAEEVDEDEELEEATQFSKKVADPKGGAGDADASAGSMKPAKHTTVASQGKPVHAKDGGEGKKDHGGSVTDHTPTDNIDVEPKKA